MGLERSSRACPLELQGVHWPAALCFSETCGGVCAGSMAGSEQVPGKHLTEAVTVPRPSWSSEMRPRGLIPPGRLGLPAERGQGTGIGRHELAAGFTEQPLQPEEEPRPSWACKRQSCCGLGLLEPVELPPTFQPQPGHMTRKKDRYFTSLKIFQKMTT